MLANDTAAVIWRFVLDASAPRGLRSACEPISPDSDPHKTLVLVYLVD
jgi:hypothetical protein